MGLKSRENTTVTPPKRLEAGQPLETNYFLPIVLSLWDPMLSHLGFSLYDWLILSSLQISSLWFSLHMTEDGHTRSTFIWPSGLATGREGPCSSSLCQLSTFDSINSGQRAGFLNNQGNLMRREKSQFLGKEGHQALHRSFRRRLLSIYSVYLLTTPWQ